MRKPLALDLFCGAGGVAQGLISAGFDVVGVDINPQPNYPGIFYQLDVSRLRVVDGYIFLDATCLGGTASPLPLIDSFAFVWASPPCQFATALGRARSNVRNDHQNMIPQTRELLEAIGLPYVIENVSMARGELRDPVTLCGSHFYGPQYLGCKFLTPSGISSRRSMTHCKRRDLGRFERHRCFETSGFDLVAPAQCDHKLWPKGCPASKNREPYSRRTVAIGQYGAATCVDEEGNIIGEQEPMPLEYQRAVMGVQPRPIKDRKGELAELSQMVPPIYAEYIGKALLDQMKKNGGLF